MAGHDLEPWLSEQWCLPRAAGPDFVWRMEDVLDVDHRPVSPARPVACLDEIGRHLIGGARPPEPAGPGRPSRRDPEDVRDGVVNPFLVTEPFRGWRHVRVSDQRTRLHFARCAKELGDPHDPEAERIVRVLDRLNPHSPASTYAAFAPAEAKRIANRPELHHPPSTASG